MIYKHCDAKPRELTAEEQEVDEINRWFFRLSKHERQAILYRAPKPALVTGTQKSGILPTIRKAWEEDKRENAQCQSAKTPRKSVT
jgi:hypothetical protein